MRGCLRKLGIALGILCLIVVLVGTATWLYYERGERMLGQARAAYHAGRPQEALALHRTFAQQYPASFPLFESFARSTGSQVIELEDYVRAAELQESGRRDEAIVAYESFLEAHYPRWDPLWPGTVYVSLARRALAELWLERAMALHEAGEYSQAVQSYISVLALRTIGGESCKSIGVPDMQHDTCQEADAATEEGHARAREAIPTVYLHWAAALGGGEECGAYVESYRGVRQAHPDLFTQSEVREAVAQTLNCWAGQLQAAQQYEQAVEEYQALLREFGDTPAAAQAQEGLASARDQLAAWREANPALPAVEFPAQVTRDAEGRWSWTIQFAEKSGEIGYTVSAEGWIVDVRGARYGTWGSVIRRGPLTVPPGGTAEDSYWCRGDSFADGHAMFTWSGEDSTGHPISIEERVHLLP